MKIKLIGFMLAILVVLGVVYPKVSGSIILPKGDIDHPISVDLVMRFARYYDGQQVYVAGIIRDDIFNPVTLYDLKSIESEDGSIEGREYREGIFLAYFRRTGTAYELPQECLDQQALVAGRLFKLYHNEITFAVLDSVTVIDGKQGQGLRETCYERS